ncbi:hypothetical protein AGOR_G00143410 [Albula goreensis]|uniref:Integrin beta n=1 Tax=Albula goreensis TaxID=1534307 RepID=A0A8T3D9D7_9TELE|nr:hypothetical protein AGOR_G00143410 [Albula goreensis]
MPHVSKFIFLSFEGWVFAPGNTPTFPCLIGRSSLSSSRGKVSSAVFGVSGLWTGRSLKFSCSSGARSTPLQHLHNTSSEGPLSLQTTHEMELKIFFIAALFGTICFRGTQGETSCSLERSRSCGECIQVGEECRWCTDPDFLQFRCNDLQSLKKMGCGSAFIENPRGSVTIIQNMPVTDPTRKHREELIQIQPQKLTLNLRPGEAQSFQLKFRRAEDYPIDLYYLIDLSFSMKEDLEKIKNLGSSLMMEMSSITSRFRIGLGSVVETAASPCTGQQQCTGPFSFKNLLKLTTDMEQFRSLLGQQQISGNLDSPKGGFDALMQGAVCDDAIGWGNVTRLLVFATDAGFHFTGDGKLDGVKLPDGKCRLENMYNLSQFYSNFAVARVDQKLRQNDIQTIFAVTETHPLFKQEKKLLPESGFGTLSTASSDVISLIKSLSSEVILENSKLPEGVTITYQSRCKNGLVGEGEFGRKCSNISIGDEVSFTISIQANKCPKQGQSETIKIKPLGFTEEVEIVLNFICECSCQAKGEEKSPICHNGNGRFECGACRCYDGRIGRQCECSIDDIFSDALDANCRRDNGTDICSNNGDCICGTCDCRKRDNPEERYSGKFCECDNFNCDRSNNKLCGGHGRCECRVCICDPNYTGSACDCSLDTTTCLATNKQICNGRGICQCGNCKCTDPKFQGPTCEICPTCPGVCVQHKECVQCRAFGTGEKRNTCERDCSYFNLIKVKDHDKLPQPVEAFPLRHCKERTEDDSWFYYTYANINGKKEVHVVETLDAPRQTWGWWR